MDRKRVVHQLDTPFAAVQWPEISQEDQDSILELLCSLLSPLGQYRREHITTSRGKRKREAHRGSELAGHSGTGAPPRPEITSYVDVGLACITRNLQTSSNAKHSPTSTDCHKKGEQNEERGDGVHYSAIFVARSGLPSALYSHLPQMVAVASESSSAKVPIPIRLVGFSRSCEDRLSECLGIPRMSAIAIRTSAPRSKALIDFVDARVPAVEVSWLREAGAACHLDTKINAVEIPVGAKRQKKEAS